MKLHELFESPTAKEFLAMLAKQNQPPELKIYEVKSKAQYDSLLAKFKILRGVAFDNKVIVWNAHDFAHVNYYDKYGKEPNTISFMTDGHQIEISSKTSPKQIRQSALGRYLPDDVEFVDQETYDIIKETR